MAKFKIGDRVRVIKTRQMGGNISTYELKLGEIVTIKEISRCPLFIRDTHKEDAECGGEECFELVTTKETKPVARRTFKLIKQLPDAQVGALFQEECEDGTQPYACITPELLRNGATMANYSARAAVEDEPTYFVEVFKVAPEYMTIDELDRYHEFVKGSKPAKRAYTRHEQAKQYKWSAERRAAQSRKIKAYHARKRRAVSQ